jgi:Tfp pilus assembly protein FimV
MIYEPPQRVRRRRPRSALDSPILAAALILVVAGIVAAIVLVPGILPSFGPGPGQSTTAGNPNATPAGPSPVPTFARPTPSPAPTFRPYEVKPGDTLNSIARRFKTDGRSLAWWNRGFYPTLDPESRDYDPNTIRVGWMLVVQPGIRVDDENPPEPIGTPRETPR